MENKLDRKYAMTEIKDGFDSARWPNFSRKELSCHCCGLFVQNDEALDALQKLRNLMGRPLRINSATRCKKHNAAEGGASKSEHLTGRAFDIHVGTHDRRKLYWSAQIAGFTGFGFGNTFLHVDTGKKRFWNYGSSSKAAWKGIMP